MLGGRFFYSVEFSIFFIFFLAKIVSTESINIVIDQEIGYDK